MIISINEFRIAGVTSSYGRRNKSSTSVMLEVGQEKKQERTKERIRRDQLQVVDTNKPMVHPDLLADLASHRPGFIDCKLRTCVELCYFLSYDIMHCSLY